MNIVRRPSGAGDRTGGRWRRIVLGDVLAEHVVELRGRARVRQVVVNYSLVIHALLWRPGGLYSSGSTPQDIWVGGDRASIARAPILLEHLFSRSTARGHPGSTNTVRPRMLDRYTTGYLYSRTGTGLRPLISIQHVGCWMDVGWRGVT